MIDGLEHVSVAVAISEHWQSKRGWRWIALDFLVDGIVILKRQQGDRGQSGQATVDRKKVSYAECKVTQELWEEVEGDVAAAVHHYQMATALHEKGGFDDPGLSGYLANMALMHAMQSAHISLESALLKILSIIQGRATRRRYLGDRPYQAGLTVTAQLSTYLASRPV